MVCNLVTYRARSAVREVGYALGFPRPLVDRVAKALETYDSVMVRRDLEADGGFARVLRAAGRGSRWSRPRPSTGARPDRRDGPAGSRAGRRSRRTGRGSAGDGRLARPEDARRLEGAPLDAGAPVPVRAIVDGVGPLIRRCAPVPVRPLSGGLGARWGRRGGPRTRWRTGSSVGRGRSRPRRGPSGSLRRWNHRNERSHRYGAGRSRTPRGASGRNRTSGSGRAPRRAITSDEAAPAADRRWPVSGGDGADVAAATGRAVRRSGRGRSRRLPGERPLAPGGRADTRTGRRRDGRRAEVAPSRARPSRTGPSIDPRADGSRERRLGPRRFRPYGVGGPPMLDRPIDRLTSEDGGGPGDESAAARRGRANRWRCAPIGATDQRMPPAARLEPEPPPPTRRHRRPVRLGALARAVRPHRRLPASPLDPFGRDARDRGAAHRYRAASSGRRCPTASSSSSTSATSRR